MTFTSHKHSWLRETGAGAGTLSSPGAGSDAYIAIYTNTNSVVIQKMGHDSGSNSYSLTEFVEMLNEIGITASVTLTSADGGSPRTIGAVPTLEGDPFEAAWGEAKAGTARKGDRVITRTLNGTTGEWDYGTFHISSDPVTDVRVRILERAEEPEVIPEWVEGAKIISAIYDDERVVAELDEDGDWLIYSTKERLAGEYVFGADRPQDKLSEVEILVAA